MSGVLIRRGEDTGTERRPREDRQRSGGHCQEARHTQEGGPPPAAGRGTWTRTPGETPEGSSLADTWLSNSWFQCQRIYFCCFNRPQFVVLCYNSTRKLLQRLNPIPRKTELLFLPAPLSYPATLGTDLRVQQPMAMWSAFPQGNKQAVKAKHELLLSGEHWVPPEN